MNNTIKHTDYLVVGSGLAGLCAAIHASEFGAVTLVTKSRLSTSSSFWAQGGIAAVVDKKDSYNRHINDTLEAGRGYCNQEAVELLVREGAERVRDLIRLGMKFDRNGEELQLGLEGGHSRRRILHANGASTGKALIDFLITLIRAKKNITVIEHAFVNNLVAQNGICTGAHAWQYEDDTHIEFISDYTILATGGYSGLYLRTTNPHTSTGDGLWLAYNAGAKLKDLEFVQFHPTAFYKNKSTTFLISEALRGEGGYLLNERFERFMEGYKQKELSPRDVVSREILNQIDCQTSDHVYLDLRHLDVPKIKKRYQEMCERLGKMGIDPAIDLIPVAPAAHYCIGGIETDLNARTSISCLYACGEVANAGVHGANRLASNSLLECLVFSKRAVDHAVTSGSQKGSDSNPFIKLNYLPKSKPLFQLVKKELSNLLSCHVGIVRDEKGLHDALEQIGRLQKSLPLNEYDYYSIRSKNALKIAELITRSALLRKESRGVHQRMDFKDKNRSSVPIYHMNDHFETV